MLVGLQCGYLMDRGNLYASMKIDDYYDAQLLRRLNYSVWAINRFYDFSVVIRKRYTYN